MCAHEQKQSHPIRFTMPCSALFVLVLPDVTSVYGSFFSKEVLVTVPRIVCASDYSQMSLSVQSHWWERRDHLVRSQPGFGARPGGKNVSHSSVCLLATVS